MEGAPGSDIVFHTSQRVEAVENLKVNERRGNVYENKRLCVENRGRSGNVVENKGSYATNAGMLLKTKGVIGNAELHATSISSVNTMTLPRESYSDETG